MKVWTRVTLSTVSNASKEAIHGGGVELSELSCGKTDGLTDKDAADIDKIGTEESGGAGAITISDHEAAISGIWFKCSGRIRVKLVVC